MFESDIERAKFSVIEALGGDRQHYFLRDILANAVLDYGIKQYFEAEFGWWLYEEQTLRSTSPHLDLNDPNTQTILHSLDAQYRRNARFERDQLHTLSEAAVKSVLNFRVRPRTTLKWFVYRGEPTKPIHEIFLRMRFFADYRYLHEGFNQWLLKKNLRFDSMEILSVLEFEKLIKKIDDDTILELSPSQFSELIAPLYFFFGASDAAPDKQAVPIESVIIFLDDKEVYVIARKLEQMLYQHGVRFVSRDIFLRVVDEVLREAEQQLGDTAERVSLPEAPQDSIVANEVESSSVVPDADDDEPSTASNTESLNDNESLRSSAPQIESSISNEPDSSLDTANHEIASSVNESDSDVSAQSEMTVDSNTDLQNNEGWKTVSNETEFRNSEISSESSEQISSADTNPRDEASVDSNEGAEFPTHSTAIQDESTIMSEHGGMPKQTQESVTAESSSQTQSFKTSDVSSSLPNNGTTTRTAQSTVNLQSLFDARQRDNYITKLCKGDAGTFDELASRLNGAPNWKDALAILDEFYAREEVNSQSSIARDFRMTVYKRYVVS